MREQNLDALVYCNNGIGDFWLSIPAINAIRSHCGRTALVAPPKHLSVLPNSLRAALTCIPLPEQFGKSRKLTKPEITAYASARMCRVMVSMDTYKSMAFDQLCEELEPKEVFGFFNGTDGSHGQALGSHMGDLLFSLARRVCSTRPLSEQSFRIAIRDFDAESEERASRILSHLGAGRKLVVVHTTGSEVEKCLPARVATDALLRFLRNSPEFTALVVDVGEFPTVTSDASLFSAPGLRLSTAAAVVARAQMGLVVDPCFRHQLDSLEIPVVALYGSTNPRLWGRRFGRGKDLVFDTMQAASATEIANALTELVQQMTVSAQGSERTATGA